MLSCNCRKTFALDTYPLPVVSQFVGPPLFSESVFSIPLIPPRISSLNMHRLDRNPHKIQQIDQYQIIWRYNCEGKIPSMFDLSEINPTLFSNVILITEFEIESTWSFYYGYAKQVV